MLLYVGKPKVGDEVIGVILTQAPRAKLQLSLLFFWIPTLSRAIRLHLPREHPQKSN